MIKPKPLAVHDKAICGHFRKTIRTLTVYLTDQINTKTNEVGLVHANLETQILVELTAAVQSVNELHYDYTQLIKHK